MIVSRKDYIPFVVKSLPETSVSGQWFNEPTHRSIYDLNYYKYKDYDYKYKDISGFISKVKERISHLSVKISETQLNKTIILNSYQLLQYVLRKN